MGDRGNIVVFNSDEAGLNPDDRQDGAIFLYTHWGGTYMAGVLTTALKKHWRWDDTSYLTRIIYDELVGDSAGCETGYGIATYAPDNEHPYLVVDTATQSVYVIEGNELVGTTADIRARCLASLCKERQSAGAAVPFRAAVDGTMLDALRALGFQ